MTLARACRFAALTWLLVAAVLPALAGDKPQRIVSMNLCLDRLLLELVEPRRIASLSFLSAEPSTSTLARQAQRFPLNHGLAEEILPLEPDLVLAGAGAARPTVDLLRRFGYRVMELPLADELSDVSAQLMAVARAVGEARRGRALVADLEDRLAALAPPPGSRRPLAAVYAANGYTYGQGTLVGAVVEAAGFDNLADRMNLTGISQLSLELLVAADPDVLILGVAPAQGSALAGQILRHPALREAFPPAARLIVPEPLWNCGTPAIAEAVARLTELRTGGAWRIGSVDD